MAQNNPALYDAMLAGGCGGTLSRWITATNMADYTDVADAVEAFATAVDAAIEPIGGDGPSLSQINLIQSLVEGVCNDRDLESTNPSSFAEIAAAISAAFEEASTRLNNVPPIGGGDVESVFGRTGIVIAEAGDYDTDLIDNSSDLPGATLTEALNSINVERIPTQMVFTEIFRQDWMAVTQSGVVNPAFQTNRLQPTGMLWVNDDFSNTNPARFTTVTEATAMTFTLPGTTAVLTSPATAGNKMSLIYEGQPLGMPHLMASVRVVSRTGTNGAYSAILLGVVKDSNNYIVINWNTVDGTIALQSKIAGVNNFDASTNLSISNIPLTLGISIVGNWVTVYWLPESGSNSGIWQKIFGFNLVTRVDFKAQDMSLWFPCFGFATPGTNLNVLTLDDFKAGRFGGVGIRDICIVNDEGGNPRFASATTVYALATIAGPSGGIAEASQAAFVIDLEKKTITQTGVIMVSRGGKIQNDHAACMVLEDNGDQHYLVSSWGDTPTAVNVLYKFQAVGVNLLNGSNVVTVTALNLPNPGGVAIDYYDPYLIKKNGVWYLAYTVSPATPNGFFPALANSNDLVTWNLVGSDSTAIRYEGTRILPFEGVSYVLTGGQFNMRMYDLAMNYIGIVNCMSPGDGTTQPHAMIFPYQSNNLYYLITFDQTKWPTTGGLAFSWGSQHWFASPRY